MDDSYTTGFNEILTVNAANGLLENDSDPDGNPISVTLVSGESLGSIDISPDGSFTYTPNDGASGTETIEYTISDGYDIATGTITITIQPMIDCAGVVNGTSVPGSLCDNDGVAGIYSSDCNCEPIPLASLDGNVSWNGACGEREIKINVFNQDFPSLNAVFYTTMDVNGNFSSPEFPSGSYNLLIKVQGYLARLYPNTEIVSGTNSLDVNSLIPGDLNGDNFVNLLDISVINAAFGSTAGDSNYNPIADLNCDGLVNVLDVSVLNTSFGLAGETN